MLVGSVTNGEHLPAKSRGDSTENPEVSRAVSYSSSAVALAAAPAGCASNCERRDSMTGESGLISMMRLPFIYSIARSSAIV
jgi:hypothetical protein